MLCLDLKIVGKDKAAFFPSLHCTAWRLKRYLFPPYSVWDGTEIWSIPSLFCKNFAYMLQKGLFKATQRVEAAGSDQWGESDKIRERKCHKYLLCIIRMNLP